jgi:hypothetical protein
VIFSLATGVQRYLSPRQAVERAGLEYIRCDDVRQRERTTIAELSVLEPVKVL